MAVVNWPTIGRKVPNDIGEHAARLKAEFDSVSDTANVKLSNTNQLPAGLGSRIEQGIESGIAEARSNGYCPRWSEIDKTIFTKVLLKNITTASAPQARDRVPLTQFHGLRKSFDGLCTKLRSQSSTTSETRPAIAASVATQPTPANNPVNAAPNPKDNLDHSPVKAPKRVASAPQEEKEKSVSSEDTDSDTGTDTSEDEEGDCDQNANARDGQEAIEDGEDVESGGESSEDGSNVSVNGSNTEEGVNNIVRDGKGFKTSIILNIEQQATVNRLEGMTAAELSACLSLSLKKYLRQQQLSSRSVQIVSQKLLDDGNIILDLRAETRENLQQLISLENRDQDFERLVCPPVIATYKVVITMLEVNTVGLQNRKEKAATIRMLASANGQPVIRDIYWPSYSSCGVSFGKAAAHINVKERRRNTGSSGAAIVKLTVIAKASALLPNVAEDAPGPIRQRPASRKQRKLEFPTKPLPPAAKPAAEAHETSSPQVRHSTSAARTQTETSMPSPVSLDAADEKIEAQSEQLLREASPSPDIHSGCASKRELDELRRMITALKSESPGGTKRQADEAFAGGAEAESSYKGAIPMKRIKREQPSREGSMGLYRQPSPYIVNRSQSIAAVTDHSTLTAVLIQLCRFKCTTFYGG
ncbi:hypothetical protein BDR22DRAFT_892837 [Usnea florida]